MENNVTTRLLALYEHLKSNMKVAGYSDFASKIGVSASMINEITKGRSQPGLKVIQNTVNAFREVNSFWLLIGEGEMLKKEIVDTSYSEEYEKQIEDLRYTIEIQKELIKKLKNEGLK